jgi:hypothetical protein
LNNANDD